VITGTNSHGCAQNFGLNCTLSNNVLAFVNENHFTPGSMLAGQTCAGNTGAAVYNSGPATGPQRAAFNFSHNIVYWRQGPLLGGGTSLFVSSFDSNLYFDARPSPDTTAKLNDTGFPCAQSYGPVNPATANGTIYNGQSLFAPKVLLSHGKLAWAVVNASGSLCVGRGDEAGKEAVWCTPPGTPLHGEHADRVTVQGDGNLCVTNASAAAWCAQPHNCPQQGEYYAQLHDNCTHRAAQTQPDHS
jgi:hypothetical protein